MSTGTRRPQVLVVEDEAHLAAGISENLDAEGYHPEVVVDGCRALERILSNEHDLVILDVMLPGQDGFSICREVRELGNSTPILFLTARSETGDRLRGFESGCDDYLPKPFHLQELLYRVRALLRRSTSPLAANSTAVSFGGNSVDPKTRLARDWSGREHSLSDREAAVLTALAARPDELVSREDLLEEVWGDEVLPATRVLDQIMASLRRRFEPVPEQPQYLVSIDRIGYCFAPSGREES